MDYPEHPMEYTRLQRLWLWVIDTGRAGQSFHFLYLAVRGGPCSRKAYLRGLWGTLRYGPRY